LEQLSIRPLHFVRRLPKLVIPIAMGALLFAGLLITEPWAGLLLLVLAGFLAWLLALSWPVLVVAAIVVAAFWRFTGSA